MLSYDGIKKEYDKIYATEGIRDSQKGYKWIAKKVISAYFDRGSLLDIACGAGYFLKEIQAIVKKRILGTILYGLDISEEALRIAKNECPSVFFYEGIAESLPVFMEPDGWGKFEQ